MYIYMCVCPPSYNFNRENENNPLESVVPHFQTKPYDGDMMGV